MIRIQNDDGLNDFGFIFYGPHGGYALGGHIGDLLNTQLYRGMAIPDSLRLVEDFNPGNRHNGPGTIRKVCRYTKPVRMANGKIRWMWD
jgi:hypothetical protein